MAGGANAAPPDIPRSALTSSLDDAQTRALCDWYASLFGGYGHVSNCGMGMVVVPDQNTCVLTVFPHFCKTATVGQYEDCAFSGVPSNGCNLTDECRRLSCP